MFTPSACVRRTRFALISYWEMKMQKQGSLICVGVGMMLGAHFAPRAKQCLLDADVVFVAVSDPIVERWLESMHRDVRSLQHFYSQGKPKSETYGEMVNAMLAEVRRGRQVCGAFYGHPGIFARAPHEAIALARQEGYPASMEPGISAEDCLYADLAIDPGDVGCQHYEAGQFVAYRRRIDASAYLVLWQAGMLGEAQDQATRRTMRAALVGLLAEEYPLDHEIILYEAATLPIVAPRVSKMPLDAIPMAELHPWTTVVLPPARALEQNRAIMELVGTFGAGS